MKKFTAVQFKDIEMSRHLHTYLTQELFEGMEEYREKSYVLTSVLRAEVSTLSRMYDDAGSAIDTKALGKLRVELHQICIYLKAEKIEMILL